MKMRIENVTRGLRVATESNDWKKMATVNQEVADLLSDMIAKGRLPDDGRAALEQLRNAHFVALERCAHEFEKVGRRIAELIEKKEGWFAYALGTHAEGSKS